MSQKQYFKTIEREIQRINRIIDLKIVRGEEYIREARDHKLLLRKIRYQKKRNFFQRILSKFFRSKLAYA